jgi:transposase
MGTDRSDWPRSRWELRKLCAELHAQVLARDRRIAVLEKERADLQRLVGVLWAILQAMQERLQRFARMLFGRSSERLGDLRDRNDPAPDATPPGHPGDAADAGQATPVPAPDLSQAPKRRRGAQPGHPGHGRRIPHHLPREDRLHLPAESDRVCSTCGKPFHALGEGAEEVSFEVDVRIEYVLLRHRRPKYARSCRCPKTPAVVVAPPPPKLIPKGMLTVGTVVHLLIQKYLAHVPFARQVRLMREQGFALSPGTIAHSMRRLLHLFRPLYQLLWQKCRQKEHWQIDETSWRVFVEREGKQSHSWWMWIWTTQQMTLFVLDPTRSSNVILTWMDGAQGIATTDGLSAYTCAARQMPLTLHACWAHARRELIPFLQGDAPGDATTRWMQDRAHQIGTLYAYHAERRRHPPGTPLWQAAQQGLEKTFAEIEQAWRQVLAAPEDHAPAVLRLASRLARDWQALTLPLHHPELPLDNNEAERRLRELVLERHTIPGTSSEWGGQLTAILYSILQTCRQNGINPAAYLRLYLEACLRQGGGHGARAPTDLEPFLPWNLPTWVSQAAHPELFTDRSAAVAS